MNKLTVTLLALAAAGLQAIAQDKALPASWSLTDCIDYAVVHNRSVHIQQRNNKNSHLSTIESYTAFLPYVSAGTGAQFSFGRTIDPETNTYGTVSNFSNSYSVSASLPLFNSGSLINAVRIARVQEQMGKKSLEQIRDNIAINTLQAYTDVLYYRELYSYRKSKYEESRHQLQRLQAMHEVGRRSAADLALVEAQCAADRHSLIETEAQLATTVLTLEHQMNLPADIDLKAEYLIIPSAEVPLCTDTAGCFHEADRIFHVAEEFMPATANARYSVQANRYSLRQSIASLFPSLSLSGGVSSGYFKTLERGEFDPFYKQFRDKLGYYVGVNMSIPLFGRLGKAYGVKRQRNRLRNAIDEYEQQRDNLQRTIRQAVMEREASARSVTALQKQLAADSLAYRLTARKFEEGLSGAIDLQTASANLLRTRASFLQSRLTFFIKRTLTDYYNGQKLYTL